MYQDNQGFAWDDFGNSIGDTVQNVISGFGDTTTANATNASAIANVNNAKADAIRAQAASNQQLMKYIGIALVVLVVGLIVVPLLRPILAKIKF